MVINPSVEKKMRERRLERGGRAKENMTAGVMIPPAHATGCYDCS